MEPHKQGGFGSLQEAEKELIKRNREIAQCRDTNMCLMQKMKLMNEDNDRKRGLIINLQERLNSASDSRQIYLPNGETRQPRQNARRIFQQRLFAEPKFKSRIIGYRNDEEIDEVD